MSVLIRPWGHLHYARSGPQGELPILFLNSLGTDLRMWDGVVERLPNCDCIRMDKRGHGLSARPDAPWTLGDLVSDARALCDHLGLRRVLVAGCSVGGMIAQGLAIAAPDLVAGLFLSNTAPRIGTDESWAARITAVQAQGMAALAPQIIDRWFAPAFRASDDVLPWQVMVSRTDALGYIGTCRVLAGADLTGAVAQIAAPTCFIAGSHDLATPPDLVAAAAAHIPGARLHRIEGAGHIPAIDHPETLARLLAEFHGDLR